MLKLSLLPEDYITIGSDIVIQLTRIAGGRASLAIHAGREVPILRGEVLERNGGERPPCLKPSSEKKARYYRDQVFRWNDDREKAVRAMREAIDQVERKGLRKEAIQLRTQLDRIIPTFWETDLAEKQRAEASSQVSPGDANRMR